MATKKKSKRGRSQDGSTVASRSKKAVKKAIKKIGASRKRVTKALGGKRKSAKRRTRLLVTL